MQLKTYIEELMVGQLSHSNLAKVLLPHLSNLNPTLAEIGPNSKYPLLLGKLIIAINSALTQLHTDLPLREDELILATNPTTDRYSLTMPHAHFGGVAYPDALKWIEDAPHAPFKDNVIECLQVINEAGIGLPINDSTAYGGVFLPAPNIIQVPTADYQVTLNILYRANHPKIGFSLGRAYVGADDTEGFVDLNAVIQLPRFLLGAVTTLIVSRYYKSIGSVESIAQAQAHEFDYMNTVQTVKNSQLIHGDFTSTDPISDFGWV